MIRPLPYLHVFGSTYITNPRDAETKNDAMVKTYPLEGPKLIILPIQIANRTAAIGCKW